MSWPTPAARDAKGANSRQHCETNGTGRKHMDQLANAVAFPYLRFPTPTSSMMTMGDMEQARYAGNKGGNRPSYQHAKESAFATPQARDHRTGSQGRWANPDRSRNLNDQIGGQLNPTWVEWLMGWPLGWTDCAASATDKFREWCQSHGLLSPMNDKTLPTEGAAKKL
ncbi:MAG: hypothetical protein QM607_12485 [Microbacterium sp.]